MTKAQDKTNKMTERPYEELKRILERATALQTALVLFEWDNETLAPKEADEYTARMIGSLSEQYLELITSEQVKQLK